jgi:Holliday junction resolvase RusA-like endonuclease
VTAALSPRPYFLSFSVGYLPPMNTSSTRRHWSHAHREVKRWRAIVAVQRPKPAQPLERALVTLVRLSSSRPDYDNMVFSWKECRDSLVHCGFVVDDSPEHMEMIYRWEKVAPKRGMCFIHVEEIA